MPHLHRTLSAMALAKRARLKKTVLTSKPERARIPALETLRKLGLSDEELKKAAAVTKKKAKIRKKKEKKKKTAAELLVEYVERTGKPKLK